ncbi:MAG: hydroxymethylglutaryl-CoA reductase, partial [Verrucomicrobiales bacterium]
MAGKRSLTSAYLAELLAERSLDEIEAGLRPDAPRLPPLPATGKTSAERARKLWTLATGDSAVPAALLDDWTAAHLPDFSGNIENCVGSLKLPLGLAGPLRVNGIHARGDFVIPLATSEAALVASYHRGACLLSAAGGCTSMLLYEAVNRAPAFVFRDMVAAGRFVAWTMENFARLKAVAEETSRFA